MQKSVLGDEMLLLFLEKAVSHIPYWIVSLVLIRGLIDLDRSE